MELYSQEGKPSVYALAGALAGDVATEVERRSLSYSRNLERYQEYGMPWPTHCLVRLPKDLPQPQRLLILTFLSCVGMIQNEDYVSFADLGRLLKDMGMAQSQLQNLHLQSKFLLPKVFAFKLWRLHESVPYRMGAPPKPPSHRIFHLLLVEDAEREEEDVQAADAEEVRPDTSRGLYVAANSKKHWTQQEVSFIDTDPKIKRAESYKRYLEACKTNMVPARSRNAFNCKYDSLKNKQ